MPRKVVLLFFFLFLFIYSLTCEDIIPIEEAPEAIFETQIGDADVDLFLFGSWQAQATAATGIRLGPGASTLFPFTPPNMEEGFIFEQVPDLTLSLWIMERYFLEISILEDFADNTYLMGYQGREEEFLQHVYIGNRDISIDPYPFLEIPEQETNSLGISAAFDTGISKHQLMLRYDNNEQLEKLYIGKNEVSEGHFAPDQYLGARYFILPDDEVKDLQIYLEDAEGNISANDGKSYRLAGSADVIIDSKEGTVFLKEEPKGRVLAFYRKNGLSVGHVNLGLAFLPGVSGNYIDLTLPPENFNWNMGTYLGQDMAQTRIMIEGKDCLLLWQPKRFSPFAMLAHYDLSSYTTQNNWDIKIKAIYKSNPDSNYTFSWPISFKADQQKEILTAYMSDNLRADMRNRYPFPDAEHYLYGPYKDAIPAWFDYEIFFQVFNPVNEYVLGTDVIPGSVSIKRNGIEEKRFEMDYASGSISFLTYIHPQDRLEITYRVATSRENNGDLLFAWGNIIPLSSFLTLDIASGVRWNVLPGTYSDEAYSRTGAVIGSVSLEGEHENISYTASAAVSYTNPDTSGIFRLLGMEGEGLALELNEDLAYPAAVPEDITGPPLITGLTRENRGKLFYKDYRQYGPFGSVVFKDYEWQPPADQIFAYETGSKPGPYTVAGNSLGDKGQSLVMDFEIPANKQWVGFQLPVAYTQDSLDLSDLKSILLSAKAVDVEGEFDLYLQVGALGEDIDGDAVLDREASDQQAGFHFDDVSNAASLWVGSGPRNQGNGHLETEDVDGNGILDDEETDYIYSIDCGTINNDFNWRVLGDNDDFIQITEQKSLKKVRSIRVLLIRNSTTPCSGRILIDKLALSRSSFFCQSQEGNITARELDEKFALYPPRQRLERVFPQVKNIFHPALEEQQVLEIIWDSPVETDWQCKAYLANATEGIKYNTVSLFFCTPALISTAQPELHFSLLDAEARGINLTFPATRINEWQELSVSLNQDKVFLNGMEMKADLTVDDNYGSFKIFAISMTGGDAGAILLDELHLKEPEATVGSAFALDLELTFPDTLVSIGQVPVLSDLRFQEQAQFSTRGFSSLYGIPAQSVLTNSYSELGMGIFFVGINCDVLVEGIEDDFSLSGGHLIKIPRFAFPVSFQDAFSVRERNWGKDFSRENIINITLPDILLVSFNTGANSTADILKQKWSGLLDFSLLSPFNLAADGLFSISFSEFNYEELIYFESWIEAYRYWALWNQGPLLDRNGIFNFNPALNTQPVGVGLNANLWFKSFNFFAMQRTQTNGLYYNISLPIKFGDISITPVYTREFQARDIYQGYGNFGQDLDTLFANYAEHDYIFTQVPVQELFAQETIDIFARKAGQLPELNYTPQASISFSRNFGSYIYDLFLPSKLEVAYLRKLYKQDQLFEVSSLLTIKSTANAINLFGDYGAYPLFSFYNVDEYATSLFVSLAYDEDLTLTGANLNLENLLNFEGDNKNLFSLFNRVTWEIAQQDIHVSDNGRLGYEWFIYPETGVNLPLLSEKITAAGYYKHMESLEFLVNRKGTEQITYPLNLQVKHTSAIEYPDFGNITAEIGLEGDWQVYKTQENEEEIVILGIKGGIGINLKF